MGSFKSDDRDRKPRRRPKQDGRRPLTKVEALEERMMLSGATDEAPRWLPTSNDISDVKNGPMAKAGTDLISLYQAFQRGGSDLHGQIAKLSPYILFSGEKVGVDIYAYGDFNQAQAAVKSLGMEVVATDATLKIIEGYLPVSQLRAVSEMAQTIGVSPIYRPKLAQQGAAGNQGDATMRGDLARTQFGVDGTGITVGVISDSASRFAGGIADSQATGDLPASNRINVIADEPVGGNNSDEGRAMMELIYDIAPGANLAFHTGFTGRTAMANGIRALAAAGAQVIVDDIGYANEPAFQDGEIARAVSEVTAGSNVNYFSSAGNSGDNGYESDFRGTTGNVTGVGNGRFMDFDPGAGVLTQFPITVNAPGLFLFWWDDPYFTTNGVDTDMDIFILDGSGNVVASGQTNSIASQVPQEFVVIPNAGNFTVAIRNSTGSDPARVRFQEFSSDVTVPQTFGGAGGTTYPTTFGHPTSADAIGVGAVPYFNAPPVNNTPPILSEDFSSHGPTTIYFNADGTRLPVHQVRLKPDLSGPDGVNTTFFPPGGDIANDPDTFPNFFGTSASAPNVAAVGALMRQSVPTATTTQIRTAMRTTATTLNNATPGTWEKIGGYGLVDAPRALASIGQLKVLSTTPANGATLTAIPSTISFTFSKAIDVKTLQPSDLVFTQLPAGMTAANIQVLSVTAPTSSSAVFQIKITPTAGVSANGTYVFGLADGAVSSTDGSALVGTFAQFSLADNVAPRVTKTMLVGRILIVEFSEQMLDTTTGTQNIQLIRSGGTGVANDPANVVVTDDPRVAYAYDTTRNWAIFNLSALPQTLLPSDVYFLLVKDAATDLAGNRLDGEFDQRTFPSGNGTAGGDFTQNLGGQLLKAPQVVNVGLTAASDTGIAGDQNTNVARPTVTGSVLASFPGTNAGLTVAVQFLQNHPNDFTLNTGNGGRGFSGTPDLIVNTDASGNFTITPPFDLRDGFHRVRIVVIADSDFPPLPGLSTLVQTSFRVDTTKPIITSSSVPSNARLASLRDLTLVVADAVAPADVNDKLAVPIQLDLSALDPSTATNISNYRLYNTGADRHLGTGGDDENMTRFLRSAAYTSTSSRTLTSDPYTGRISLSFADGLPAGLYVLVARTDDAEGAGLRDSAGNPLDNDPTAAGNQGFHVYFDLQPEPAYITGFEAISPSNTTEGLTVSSGPRGYYEIQSADYPNARAESPPTEFKITFSNTLAPRDYSGAVKLLRSADDASAIADGDFGTGGTAGRTEVTGLTVTLQNSVPGATIGQAGYMNQLYVQMPAAGLKADYYRLYLPNDDGQEIFDIFGNQVDLEFLGNEKPTGVGYEVLLPDGSPRDGYTGDTVAGGAFTTGFIVVPPQWLDAGDPLDPDDDRVRGNIIYTRPDYVDDPFLPGDDPDGSIEKPFPTLVAEAVANGINAGDLNSKLNFGTGFDRRYDRNANGRFDRSAFFEAQQNGIDSPEKGPVVIVTLPGIAKTDPTTFETVRQPYVISSAAGADPSKPENEASASVPANTMLVLGAGTSLKMYNASLFVQNQGSALQIQGTSNPNDQVIITSLLDDAVGGDTNADGSTTSARGGDWGGLVFRNYDDVTNRGNGTLKPDFPVDGRLGLSGADDVMSIVNFATLRFGGGAVPQTIGTRYDSVTLYNSRPTLTNLTVADSTIAGTTDASGTQAAISADFDSLREDDVARGPLIRRATLKNNSINGLLIRPALGQLQSSQTNAIFYDENPPEDGASRIFTIDDPLPYVVASQLVIGQSLRQETGGLTESVEARLYVQPGMMVKFRPGASMAVLNELSSLNIGDRAYLNAFDGNHNTSPADVNFRANTANDARVLFTSLFDDAAFTEYVNPVTGVSRTIIPAGATDNDSTNIAPSPGDITNNTDDTRWGSVSIFPGAVGVIDEAEFRYGGGALITPLGTLPPRQVLDLTDNVSLFLTRNFGGLNGAFVSVTNNNFLDNQDAAIVVEPNQLLAADPTRPLASGNPFFRGNLMQRNDINGLAIKTTLGVVFSTSNQTDFVFAEIPNNEVVSGPNLNVNSVWDDTDLVHVLRGTIMADGYAPSPGFGNTLPVRPVGVDGPNGAPELAPSITLTIQSALPDTVLANGAKIARPGESMYVKLLNYYGVATAGPGTAVDPDLPNPGANNNLNEQMGAGFNFGFDDGVDPPAVTAIVDSGLGSQLRIVGIGANETTGQQRVPVVMTSLRDSTVGPTVRGVSLADSFERDRRTGGLTGTALVTPAAGDGGIIGFGAFSLTDWDLWNPANGSLIDNADISYIHRIEMQGGGLVDFLDDNLDGTITNLDGVRQQKLGLRNGLRYNSANSMTISNSNLASFRDAGVFMNPGFDVIGRIVTTTGTVAAETRLAGLGGQPNNLFFLNNTVVDMPVGIRVNAPTYGDNVAAQQSPQLLTVLHSTFYNNGVPIRTDSPAFNGTNSLSHVYFLAMNNIFDGAAIGADANAAAIRTRGQVPGSEATFNVFSGYPSFVNSVDIQNTSPAPFRGNTNPIFQAPQYFDAANGNFFLVSGSAGIDAALSELGPVAIGDALYPISNRTPGITTPVDPNGGVRNTVGRVNSIGGLSTFAPSALDTVSLPGSPGRSFVNQFVPVAPGTTGSYPGLATNTATYNFLPLSGERDLEGYLRLDDPSTANVGFGSRPFFDIGAREHRQLDPPHVIDGDVNGDGVNDGVAALIRNSDGTVTYKNLYSVGGEAGTQKVPSEIVFQFDKLLDPSTVNNLTVILEASGGDGNFNNGFEGIDLSGKLRFENSTRRLIVNLSGVSEQLGSDLYRIRLLGTGGNVLRDPQGNALDGENLDANGAQLPLPSGNQFPGGDFVIRFSVDASAPSVVPNSFVLDPSADSGARDAITNLVPAFSGTVTDIFPPTNPLLDQDVVLDLDMDGDGVFELMNVGFAKTDATGRFLVTYGLSANGQSLNLPALPDTNFNVGPDGKLQLGGDDTGYSVARVRVTDVSGNPAETNPLAWFVYDSTAPKITAATPAPGSLATVSGGVMSVSFRANENLDLASLRATDSLKAVRAGTDGKFGTTDDVTLTIDPSSITMTYLGGDPKGPVEVKFNVGGAGANDTYRITVSSAVTDVATNALDGEFAGSFPTGNGSPGGDFNFDVIVYQPGNSRIIFVDDSSFSAAPTGSRSNPYPTITAGLAVAGIGDTVAVLPGVYNEAVTLKSLVKVVSAGGGSTDTFLIRGVPQQTIIRAPLNASGQTVTVSGSDLLSLDSSLLSQFSGFAVAAPLSGVNTGSILSDSVGVSLTHSAVTVENNIVFNAHHGIDITPNEGALKNAVVSSNQLVGNHTGLYVYDQPNASGSRVPVKLVNNTIAYNNTGAEVDGRSGAPVVVEALNNIFWQNRDPSTSSGLAIWTSNAGSVTLKSNLFFANGADTSTTADDLAGTSLYGGLLTSTPSVSVNAGNYTGNPSFAAPSDPRPAADGPTRFLLNANFAPTAASAAIDTALAGTSPANDFIGRARVDVGNRSFPGLGPADVGAIEFTGSAATNPTNPGGGGSNPGGGGTNPGDAVIFSAPTPGAATTADDSGSTNSDYTVSVNTEPVATPTVNPGRPAQAGPGRRAYAEALARRKAAGTASASAAATTAVPSSRPFTQFLNRIRGGRS